MSAFIQAMSEEAMSHTTATMITLHSQRAFTRWITIDDPWQPDLSLLHLFGSLPDIDRRFNTASRRQVRCSPQLAAFIIAHTAYKDTTTGPSPEVALNCLLRHCFVREAYMFNNAYSPYQLLCSSHMILDMAFVRAVIAACMAGPGCDAGRLYSDLAAARSRCKAMSHKLASAIAMSLAALVFSIVCLHC